MPVVAKTPKQNSAGGRPPKYSGPPVPAGVKIDPALDALIPKLRQKLKRESGVTATRTEIFNLALRRLFETHGLLDPEAEGS